MRPTIDVFTSYPEPGAITLDLTRKHIILEVVFYSGVVLKLSNAVKPAWCRNWLKTRLSGKDKYSGAITIPTALQKGRSIDKNNPTGL